MDRRHGGEARAPAPRRRRSSSVSPDLAVLREDDEIGVARANTSWRARRAAPSVRDCDRGRVHGFQLQRNPRLAHKRCKTRPSARWADAVIDMHGAQGTLSAAPARCRMTARYRMTPPRDESRDVLRKSPGVAPHLKISCAPCMSITASAQQPPMGELHRLVRQVGIALQLETVTSALIESRTGRAARRPARVLLVPTPIHVLAQHRDDQAESAAGAFCASGARASPHVSVQSLAGARARCCERARSLARETRPMPSSGSNGSRRKQCDDPPEKFLRHHVFRSGAAISARARRSPGLRPPRERASCSTDARTDFERCSGPSVDTRITRLVTLVPRTPALLVRNAGSSAPRRGSALRAN